MEGTRRRRRRAQVGRPKDEPARPGRRDGQQHRRPRDHAEAFEHAAGHRAAVARGRVRAGAFRLTGFVAAGGGGLMRGRLHRVRRVMRMGKRRMIAKRDWRCVAGAGCTQVMQRNSRDGRGITGADRRHADRAGDQNRQYGAHESQRPRPLFLSAVHITAGAATQPGARGHRRTLPRGDAPHLSPRVTASSTPAARLRGLKRQPFACSVGRPPLYRPSLGAGP